MDVDDFYAELGARIKTARVSAGLTQLQLAGVCGLTRSSIANLEAGRQRTPVHVVVQLVVLLKFELPTMMISGPEVQLIIDATRRMRADRDRVNAALEELIRLAHEARWPPDVER